MNSSSRGSALLHVILVGSLLVLMVSIFWINISQVHEIVLEKKAYEVEFRLLDSLCMYAGHASSVLCARLTEKPGKVTCTFAHWPPIKEKKDSLYEGLIEYYPSKNTTQVVVMLKKKGVIVMSAQTKCIMAEKSGRYVMNSWHYNNVS